MDIFKDVIRKVDLLIVLDSNVNDHERMYQTSSFRGILQAKLTIKTMNASLHSGVSSGIVPDVFRISRILMSRLEDEKTGNVNSLLYEDVPPELYEDAHKLCKELGLGHLKTLPLIEGMRFNSEKCMELYMDSNYRPTVTVVGIDNIPQSDKSASVLRTEMSIVLSIRTQPWMQEETAVKAIREILLKDPPYGAQISLETEFGSGFVSPKWPKKQWEILNEAAREAYDNKQMYSIANGGSIPFMGDLARKFPHTKFLTTGILTPDSNAHGGDENLDISLLKKHILALTKFMQKSTHTTWNEGDVEHASLSELSE